MMRPMVDTLITVYAKGNNMSRIKDLLAEEQNIDDLKRPLYQKLGEMIYVKTLHAKDLRHWLRARAEYEGGKDDEGHTEWFFENFEDLCEKAVTDTMDKLIEDEHLDISDETYNRAIEYARDWLADALADFESECIQDYVMDRKYILDEVKERNGQC